MENLLSDGLKTTQTLATKVEKLLLKYHELELNNETLKLELENIKSSNEAKDIQIVKLEESLRKKAEETDELLGKIEDVLGLWKK